MGIALIAYYLGYCWRSIVKALVTIDHAWKTEELHRHYAGYARGMEYLLSKISYTKCVLSFGNV